MVTLMSEQVEHEGKDIDYKIDPDYLDKICSKIDITNETIQDNYSYRKIIRNKLIERRYTLNPFSLNQCSEFILFVKTDNTDMTLRILCNFARGGRIHKEHMFCDDWGVIGCCSHSSFLIDLMYKLDQKDK